MKISYGIFNNGKNKIEILQFGLIHFELINNKKGEYNPAVLRRKRITKDINKIFSNNKKN